MNKKLIRLTESDLHRIVKESVKRIMNEVGETDDGQKMLAKLAARKSFNGDGGYFDVADYARQKRNGDLKRQDLYAKTFHKEKDRLKNGDSK